MFLTACLQVITTDHQKYEHELDNIAKSHHKGTNAASQRLVSITPAMAPGDLKARIPKLYQSFEICTGMLPKAW